MDSPRLRVSGLWVPLPHKGAAQARKVICMLHIIRSVFCGLERIINTTLFRLDCIESKRAVRICQGNECSNQFDSKDWIAMDGTLNIFFQQPRPAGVSQPS
jgi:hypothetical protein